MKTLLLLATLLTALISCTTTTPITEAPTTHFYPIHYKDFNESNFPPKATTFNRQEPATVYFAIPPKTNFGEKKVTVYFQNDKTKEMITVDSQVLKDATRAMFHINRGLTPGNYTAISKSGKKVLATTKFKIL